MIAPSNAAGTYSELLSVSCTSAGTCGGVGDYLDGTGFSQAMAASSLAPPPPLPPPPPSPPPPPPPPPGYWEVAADGSVFSFGSAQAFGAMGGMHLAKPIVGMAFDSATGGYYLVASDGGIFAINAPYLGSMGGTPLNKPIVGITSVG